MAKITIVDVLARYFNSFYIFKAGYWIRYFGLLGGSQAILFLFFLILFIIFSIMVTLSQKIESSISKGKFVKLN